MNKLFCTALSVALMCFTAACGNNSEAVSTVGTADTTEAVRTEESMLSPKNREYKYRGGNCFEH